MANKITVHTEGSYYDSCRTNLYVKSRGKLLALHAYLLNCPDKPVFFHQSRESVIRYIIRRNLSLTLKAIFINAKAYNNTRRRKK